MEQPQDQDSKVAGGRRSQEALPAVTDYNNYYYYCCYYYYYCYYCPRSQITMFALLLAAFVNDRPVAFFTIKWLAVSSSALGTLALIFVPKMLAVRRLDRLAQSDRESSYWAGTAHHHKPEHRIFKRMVTRNPCLSIPRRLTPPCTHILAKSLLELFLTPYIAPTPGCKDLQEEAALAAAYREERLSQARCSQGWGGCLVTFSMHTVQPFLRALMNTLPPRTEFAGTPVTCGIRHM